MKYSTINQIKRLAKGIKKTNPEISKKLEAILKNAMVSIKKQTQESIEGYIITAYHKYFQLMMLPNSTYIQHWFNPMRAALRHMVKDNTSTKWTRGYILDIDEVKELESDARKEGFSLAYNHIKKELGLTESQAIQQFYQLVPIEELFRYADVDLPSWEDPYKKHQSP
jgi:hypothetical protein